MIRRLIGISVALTLSAAGPAEARFGSRAASSSSSHPSSSSSSSSSTAAASTSSSSSSGRYHAAMPVEPGGGYRSVPVGPSATRYAYAAPPARAVTMGYYSRSYVPVYGYGYTVAAAPSAAVVTSGEVVSQGTVVEEQSTVRVTAGVEGQGYAGSFSAGSSGVTLAALVSVEGDRWGFAASAQNIAVRAEDGSDRFDNIQGLTAHLTFAVVAGQYGRLRLEAGADAFFAPDVIFVGPTGGVSGVLWLGGPVGVEASLMVTPWPFRQFDGRLGLAVGVGMVGLRAGWRVQTLDDMGLVDGVRHVDAFNGPYVGLSLVF